MESNINVLLRRAYESNYAVPAINVSNMETVLATLEAADSLRSPIILQVAPMQILAQSISYAEIYKIIKLFEPRFPKTDFAVHIDHAGLVEDCSDAINSGFGSVMIDGSHLSYEKNIEITRQVRSLYPEVALEAELGSLGGEEGTSYSDVSDQSKFTDSTKVGHFVQATKIDSLAVSIGNAHGFYKDLPHIRFDILEKIRRETSIPLVLHGSTGIPKEDVRRAITLGIAKVNYFSICDREYSLAYQKAFNDGKYMMFAAEQGRIAFREQVKEIIHTCMSEDRV